jgi:hypothetical protein
MYFLILTVIFLLPLSAQASDDAKTWKYKAWEVKDRGNFLLSSTQGEVVWGHQFGVLTPKNNCGANYLWLSLSTSEKGIEELKGQQIPVEIRVDKDIYQTTLEVQTLFQMGSTTVVGFNPFLLNKSFLENLKKGRELFVKIEDEGGFSNMFDIKEESFSLRGFTANYVKLSESCKDITQLEIPPNKVVLKAEVPKKTYQVKNEIKNHSQCSNNGLSNYVNKKLLRARDFTFLNNQLYFGYGNDGQDEYEDVYVINVCNPSNPLPVTRISGSASQIHGMYAQEKIIYIDSSRYDSAENKSYSSLKIISSDTYKILSEITVPTFINPFVVDSERLYLTLGNKVNIYDLDDKSNPNLVSEIDVSSIYYSISGIDVDDGLIYIVGDSDLLIYDRKTLKLAAHKTFQYRINSIIVSENRAIVTLWNNGGSNDFAAIINLQDLNDIQIETIQKIQDSKLRRVNSNFVVQDSYVGKVKLIELNGINAVFNKLISD